MDNIQSANIEHRLKGDELIAGCYSILYLSCFPIIFHLGAIKSPSYQRGRIFLARYLATRLILLDGYPSQQHITL